MRDAPIARGDGPSTEQPKPSRAKAEIPGNASYPSGADFVVTVSRVPLRPGLRQIMAGLDKTEAVTQRTSWNRPSRRWPRRMARKGHQLCAHSKWVPLVRE